MKMRRRIAGLLTVGALVASGAVALAMPSSAGGYGGKDPYATGCNEGSSIVAVREMDYGKLRLRWSPSCGTNWAVMKVYNQPTSGYVGVKVQDGIERGHEFGAGQKYYHTKMVNGANKCVRAKGVLHHDGNSSGWRGTRWACG